MKRSSRETSQRPDEKWCIKSAAGVSKLHFKHASEEAVQQQKQEEAAPSQTREKER